MSDVTQPLLSQSATTPDQENPGWFKVNENLRFEVIKALQISDLNEIGNLEKLLEQLNSDLLKVENDMRNAKSTFFNSSSTRKIIREMADDGYLEVGRLADLIASDFSNVRITMINENSTLKWDANSSDNQSTPGQPNSEGEMSVPAAKQAERILELRQKAQTYFAEVKELQDQYNKVMGQASKERLDRLKFALKVFLYSIPIVGGAVTILNGKLKVFIDFQVSQSV
jgi:molecular chaperone GrpE (heat shock protein)